MDGPVNAPELTPQWREALSLAAGKRRIVVLGATDAGKSTFIRLFVRQADRPVALIDLDPGQKMIGPPGTASLGCLDPDRLEKFIFLGSTSASNIGAIARAGAAFAAAAGEERAFIVNTSGFVLGLGARLQGLTVRSIAPDLVVGIGPEASVLLASAEGVERFQLERSPAARRKSPAARAAIRQAAFEQALSGAGALQLDDVPFWPASPAHAEAPAADALPVCALADKDGTDMCIGVLEPTGIVHAPPPPQAPALIRLGKMWAAAGPAGGWRLLEKLKPSWTA